MNRSVDRATLGEAAECISSSGETVGLHKSAFGAVGVGAHCVRALDALQRFPSGECVRALAGALVRRCSWSK